MVYGNTAGIKKSVLEGLEALAGFYEKDLIIDGGVLDEISRVSRGINREICAYISRGGQVLAVGIGDGAEVAAMRLNLKRSEEKLTGVRCFHTHLNGSSAFSEADLNALHSLRLDMLAAVNASDGAPSDISAAFIRSGGETQIVRYGSYDAIDHAEVFYNIALSEKVFEKPALLKTVKDAERVILVCAAKRNSDEYLAELKSLADTAGLNVVGEIAQIKDAPDKNFCVGSGKIEEIRAAVNAQKADAVIFDNELTGLQLRNIENALNVKAADRAMLILEIFARRAATNEGKLQIELAKLQYALPKLLGQGKALSRIGGGGEGGAATRGAGETKLETDRRHTKRMILELSEKIEKIKRGRDLRRENRVNGRIKTVALVGYTNSGKSTLMNALAKASVLAEDKLFATLDPVTRRIWTDVGKEYLLTDTVGFIDRLPHELIDAFRSTLEEAKYADLLVHVADCSSPSVRRQYDTVLSVLDTLGAGGKPIITAYNKIDLAKDGFDSALSDSAYGKIDTANDGFKPALSDSVRISAKTGEGLNELRAMIKGKLFGE
ncbi:MAG: GTPase HflX [Clostridiales bacterium]|jgi:GTP-binding protein HflX|nr:GTPase HflX [Clostridiales bacterium]